VGRTGDRVRVGIGGWVEGRLGSSLGLGLVKEG
jgi:hypothetical protein